MELTPLPRKQATYRKLLDAARDLFVEKGYERLNLSDIPKRAGVSQGTFYNHFTGKADIFLDFASEVAADMRERTLARLARDAPETLEAHVRLVIDEIGDHAAEHPQLIRTLMVDRSVIRPDDPNDPRLPDIGWASDWTNVILEWKNQQGRTPTPREHLLGFQVQFVVRAVFSYLLYHEPDDHMIRSTTADTVILIIKKAITHPAGD